MTTITLKELREHVGLTQAELAKKMGITQAGVSRVELMENMRISTLRSFVEALGCSVTLEARFPMGPLRQIELKIGK